jgi:hypothetical protein
MTERSEINIIEDGDDAAFVARANQVLSEIKAVLPEDLRCLLLCAVTKNNTVKVGILGSDTDITKMLMTVATVARNGIEQAESPSNPNNEVLQ